jgi:hypothetical protein
MTNDEKIQSQLAGMLEIASKNRLEETILNLVEWELATMDYESLQEFWVNNMTDFYKDNPKALGDMLQYMKESTDPSVDFYWDVEKKDNTDQGV